MSKLNVSPAALRYPLIVIILLHAVFVVLAFAFRDTVTLDKATLLQEYAKLLGAFFASMLALWVSRRLDVRDVAQAVGAAQRQIRTLLEQAEDKLHEVVNTDLRIFEQPPTIEDLRRINEDKMRFLHDLDAVAGVAYEIIEELHGESLIVRDRLPVLTALHAFSYANSLHMTQQNRATAEKARQLADELIRWLQEDTAYAAQTL